MKTLETERLILRFQTLDDATFILELVNDPSWLKFIGDRGIRTIEDAKNHILNGPIRMYEELGLGFLLVERKEDHASIGICGLVKRASLDDIDVGFAFLPQYRGQGYAYEATTAVMSYGRGTLGLDRIVAITAQDNVHSIKLLEKLGMKFEQFIQLSSDSEEINLFAWNR
ncbi:GNAT family N-acetyltransferase [Baia soyae]|uniref:RimJ/RimL family protein N-acetyltransferase n=1 Tax=Baia soyae TaxID=1544746 RepID=A0A4R2RQS1_9BACL|nr:GNAT family N-acetyltransferase [Baia soyae]TCP66522.1 RimJ/RimL family protein N-acetyltransferase [Baia soyae]